MSFSSNGEDGNNEDELFVAIGKSLKHFWLLLTLFQK